MRRISLLLIAVLLIAACGGGDRLVPSPGFGVATIAVQDSGRSETLEVEIAADSTARQLGLMFRQELSDRHGMLFVYPSLNEGGFWMKNTYVPLDIAFVDGSGIVLGIQRGEPLDTTVLPAPQPYMFVLEVRAGWFAEHGFGPGSRLVLPSDLPAAR